MYSIGTFSINREPICIYIIFLAAKDNIGGGVDFRVMRSPKANFSFIYLLFVIYFL